MPVYGGVAVANAPNGAESSYLYIPASEPFFSELREDNFKFTSVLPNSHNIVALIASDSFSGLLPVS